MTLVAGTAALLVDVRRCLGGEPSMVALVCSYLFDHEPVELSGTYHREDDRVRQLWTLAHVPGRRFGAAKPVYVLTSATTFSGAEALGYDLQQHGRATVVGERTRGGAHPRRGFRVDAHLEATIPVARAVNPVTGTNWEGTGIVPDVAVPAGEALTTAYRMALQQLHQHPDPAIADEVRQAMDDIRL
jgi:C-terminal processing protease CtpA/Prc